jgi:hypothetical protein
MTNILPYTPLFIKLLKSPIEYTDQSNWEKLLQYKSDLAIFLQNVGLRLVLDENDGYAFVQHIINEEDDTAIVHWTQKRPLSFEESLVLILLREMLADYEMSEATHRELIRKRKDIKEYVELFFKENASRVKFLKELDKVIDKMEDHGFIAKVEHHDIADEQRFRIKKLIKAKVNSEVLDQFKAQLENYATERI